MTKKYIFDPKKPAVILAGAMIVLLGQGCNAPSALQSTPSSAPAEAKTAPETASASSVSPSDTDEDAESLERLEAEFKQEEAAEAAQAAADEKRMQDETLRLEQQEQAQFNADQSQNK